MVTRGGIDKVTIDAKFSSSSSLGTGTRRISERQVRLRPCYIPRISTRVRCRGDASSSEPNRKLPGNLPAESRLVLVVKVSHQPISRLLAFTV